MNFNPYHIFQIRSEKAFNQWALTVFHYQYQQNKVYQSFVNHIFRNHPLRFQEISHYAQIPFLPIDFFKTQHVVSFNIYKNTPYFISSGTTQPTLSKHYISDENLYKHAILNGFEKFYGSAKDYLFIFLLPAEQERPHSSLIFMAKYLQSISKHKESGFYMNHLNDCKQLIQKHLQQNTKIFILGLSYALLDFSELKIQLNKNTIVMETGGMKGKREELPKNIFHTILKKKLGISNIHSEYGMTELLSQAYSKQNGLFYCPSWMKVLVREMDDPLAIYSNNKQGMINIIDLANVHTCSFIASSDIGKLHSDSGFEVIGRSDFSDIRGCNLMYQ